MIDQPIKVLFSDVDGTLTDGSLHYGLQGEIIKTFHVRDGAGIKNWTKHSLEFGIISARSSDIVQIRMKELSVKHVLMGAENKEDVLNTWLDKHNYTWENLAYIGDDLNDLPVIQLAGFSAAPADACTVVLQNVKYRCSNRGGKGAVREFIDFLLDGICPT